MGNDFMRPCQKCGRMVKLRKAVGTLCPSCYQKVKHGKK